VILRGVERRSCAFSHTGTEGFIIVLACVDDFLARSTDGPVCADWFVAELQGLEVRDPGEPVPYVGIESSPVARGASHTGKAIARRPAQQFGTQMPRASGRRKGDDVTWCPREGGSDTATRLRQKALRQRERRSTRRQYVATANTATKARRR
jgi:hypothetical protein